MDRVSLGPLDVLDMAELFQLHYRIQSATKQAATVWKGLALHGASSVVSAPWHGLWEDFDYLDTAILDRVHYLRSLQRRA